MNNNNTDNITMTTSRDDFFTLIHKGQRRELFAVVVQAGTLDWTDRPTAEAFAGAWNEIHRMLVAHAKHEETHFFPLLLDPTSEIVDAEHAAHAELDRSLADLTMLIGSAAGSPAPELGLTVYRQLTEFVASYLAHLLEEETVVMPAIWRLRSDDEIRAARSRFVAGQATEGAVRSRRAIMPAISRAERAEMMSAMRSSRPAAFDAAMVDAEQLLEPIDWAHLNQDLAS